MVVVMVVGIIMKAFMGESNYGKRNNTEANPWLNLSEFGSCAVYQIADYKFAYALQGTETDWRKSLTGNNLTLV